MRVGAEFQAIVPDLISDASSAGKILLYTLIRACLG